MHTEAPGPHGRRRRSRAAAFDAMVIEPVMSLTDSLASVPVVGKRLASVGALAAALMWTAGRVPGIFSAAYAGIAARRRGIDDHQRALPVAELCAETLSSVGADSDIEWPAPGERAPVLNYRRDRRRYLYRDSVRYGPAPEQTLDVWRRPDLAGPRAPMMVFVPGGGWIAGRRTLQGNALLAHLVEHGWVCLAIDYRVSPRHPWPTHINDVKTAIAWARANAISIGGDPDFVAVAGCSAGGHLAALAGLAADDPSLHAELGPEGDTAVNAVVGIYGRYDWEDRSTAERQRLMYFLEKVVMKTDYDDNCELFRAASPIAQVGPHAPPFLVVHGTGDTIIPVAQAVEFVERLRATSQAQVGYLELPGAQHGFDVIDRERTPAVVTAIEVFLSDVYRAHLAGT